MNKIFSSLISLAFYSEKQKKNWGRRSHPSPTKILSISPPGELSPKSTGRWLHSGPSISEVDVSLDPVLEYPTIRHGIKLDLKSVFQVRAINSGCSELRCDEDNNNYKITRVGGHWASNIFRVSFRIRAVLIIFASFYVLIFFFFNFCISTSVWFWSFCVDLISNFISLG